MKILQFGRSMIEMLGVLAIIGVLSIGGLLGYRRAVNNHQANQILDDVNRFAFVILERSGLALDAEIDKGDFVESGTYNLKGYQSEEAQGFSITVQSVPKGVCEALLPKAVLEYKVGIVTAGGSVDDEIIYDTLNTDLCKDTSDIAFYFGDTSNVCNAPDGDGPCTQNSDCCGGEFCFFTKDSGCEIENKGEGYCRLISIFDPETITINNKTWTHSTQGMNWWSAENWCAALGLRMVSRADIGCDGVPHLSYCESDFLDAIPNINIWNNTYHWLEDSGNTCGSFRVHLDNGHIKYSSRNLYNGVAFCH